MEKKSSLSAALLLSLTVNARHLFYGISVLEKYRGMGKIKAFLIYTLCDESFSILSEDFPPDVDGRSYCFFVSLLNYLYWAAASFVGGILGHFLAGLEGFDTTGSLSF